MNRAFCIISASLGIVTLIGAPALSVPVDSELKRLQGSWRVTEMVENGRVLSVSEMESGLPGGGLLDIVDYTVLFKSPINGVRSTRSFRLDATTYPKQIVILDGDKVTGAGIYQIDQGKLVICVARPGQPVPSDYNAPAQSGRTLMVMEPHQPSKNDASKLALPPPPRRVESTPSQLTASTNTSPSVAGRVLSDDDVVRMLIGTWQLNDGEGLVDITISSDRTFSTFRHTDTMTNFHSVFVPRPVSSGNWAVKSGQLTLTITSSWRADRTNTQAKFAVRSISSNDAIIVDTLGRVVRAIRRL